VKAGVGERWQLVAPGGPELGPSVAKQHKGAIALFGNMHVDAVGCDGAME
jgi:hypothetical protein